MASQDAPGEVYRHDKRGKRCDVLTRARNRLRIDPLSPVTSPRKPALPATASVLITTAAWRP